MDRILANIDTALLARWALPLLAALLLGFIARQSLLALARRTRRSQSLRAALLRAFAMPAAVALPLLFLTIALARTPLGPRDLSIARHAIGIGLIACLTGLGLRLVSVAERAILRQYPLDIADNLLARRIQTQTRVLARVAMGGLLCLGLASVLMTFPTVRQLGATLLASAGVLGIVAGIAAKPVFGNLIAGLQIALAQPIRLDDVVIVEGEWGRIEEITSTYVVVRVWDERRMVVPLVWFIENPFQNWTRSSAQLIGSAFLWLDYHTPMEALRAELQRICDTDPRWDGRVCLAQVTDTDDRSMQVRCLVSAGNSGDAFDLRCAVRERLIDFLRREHPQSLPVLRANMAAPPSRANAPASAEPDLPSSPRAEDGAEIPGG
ncbi:mechanosensitive ion channel family protein [Luteimonas aquatica]|uniref:mechanosensitive ion channel family protein n=1 Tax=Luteimonas aquatica TaxID=450364 RepID=UPI001F5A3C14|nr:mechanosensitive ion channel domain-containing protein [Luteimonas aquatica]